MFFTITPVLSGPVYLVCQNTFRIIGGTFFEALYRFNQAGALVVCLERYFFDTPVALTVKAEIKFCLKFNRRLDFSPDIRPEPWLWDAYNTVSH